MPPLESVRDELLVDLHLDERAMTVLLNLLNLRDAAYAKGNGWLNGKTWPPGSMIDFTILSWVLPRWSR